MIAHRADVVVCDGFVGNVVIKFFEGLTSYIFRSLRADLQQGPIAPLALLALKPGFDRMRQRFDYEQYGGAPLLGVRGVSIVTHGRAKARMIENAIRVASEAAERADSRADRRVDARAPVARALERCRRGGAARHRHRETAHLSRTADPAIASDDPARACGRGDWRCWRCSRTSSARLGRRGAATRLADDRGVAGEVRDHARRIVDGVAAQRDALDARSPSWRRRSRSPSSEMSSATILRSAIWEVLYSAATPSGETIHDAVSLARIYAGDAARRLVNGVLGSVSRSSGGGARTA